MSDSLDPRPLPPTSAPTFAPGETLDDLERASDLQAGEAHAAGPMPAPTPPPRPTLREPVALTRTWRERFGVLAWLAGSFVKLAASAGARSIRKHASNLALVLGAAGLGAAAVALRLDPADLARQALSNLIAMVPAMLLLCAAIDAAIRGSK